MPIRIGVSKSGEVDSSLPFSFIKEDRYQTDTEVPLSGKKPLRHRQGLPSSISPNRKIA